MEKSKYVTLHYITLHYLTKQWYGYESNHSPTYSTYYNIIFQKTNKFHMLCYRKLIIGFHFSL